MISNAWAYPSQRGGVRIRFLSDDGDADLTIPLTKDGAKELVRQIKAALAKINRDHRK